MAGSKINRRHFFRLGTQSALGATLAMQAACLKSPENKIAGGTGRVEVPTTCELCPNKCSVIAVVENGEITKLNPNTANPKSRGMLCARGNAGIQQQLGELP